MAEQMRRQMSKTMNRMKPRVPSVRIPKITVPRMTLPRLGKKGKKGPEKVKSGSQNGAEDAANAAPVRVGAPQLPDELATIIGSGNYVLFLGNDFLSTSAQKDAKQGASDGLATTDLLKKVAEGVKDEEKKAEILGVLTGDATAEHVATKSVVTMLQEELGTAKFNYLITKELDVSLVEQNPTATLAFKVIKSLNPKCILTTDCKSSLQKAVPCTSFVASDLEAQEITFDSIANAEVPLLIKLNGDVLKPSSLPLIHGSLNALYGYDVDGKLIEPKEGDEGSQVFSKETTYLRKFMKDVLSKFSVVFLGTDFGTSDDSPIVNLLKEVKNDTAMLKQKHFALMQQGDESALKKLSDDIGVEFIGYQPDELKTQVIEFIAYIDSAVSMSTPNEGRSYLDLEYISYLQTQLDKEKSANSICYFNSSLTESITTNMHLDQKIFPQLLKSNSKEDAQSVIDLLHARRSNLENRLANKGDNFEVRSLFLKKTLDSEFDEKDKDKLEENIVKYEHLLTLLAECPTLNVKLLRKLAAKDLEGDYEANYSLIFVPKSPTQLSEIQQVEIAEKVAKSDVLLATTVADKSVSKFFGINFLQVNTDDVEKKMVQFERCWSAALSTKDSVAYIKKKVDKARGREEVAAPLADASATAPVAATTEVKKEAEKPKDKTQAAEDAKTKRASQKASLEKVEKVVVVGKDEKPAEPAAPAKDGDKEKPKEKGNEKEKKAKGKKKDDSKKKDDAKKADAKAKEETGLPPQVVEKIENEQTEKILQKKI